MDSTLPKITFFWDKSKGIVSEDLFISVAETYAEKIVGGDSRKNKPTQIRKFYDEVVRFDGEVKQKRASFEELKPYLGIIMAKVYYAEGRSLVTGEFAKMIKDCITQTKDEHDLRVFKDFLEAFMGYLKFHSENSKNNYQQNYRR